MPSANPSPDLSARRAVVTSSWEGRGRFWEKGGWEGCRGQRHTGALLLECWSCFSYLYFRSEQQNCINASSLTWQWETKFRYGWIQVLRQCRTARSPSLNSAFPYAALCGTKVTTVSLHRAFCHLVALGQQDLMLRSPGPVLCSSPPWTQFHMNTWTGGGEGEDLPKESQGAFARRQGGACSTGGSTRRKTSQTSRCSDWSVRVSHLDSCENAHSDSQLWDGA